ncbi:MAG: electron transport complex subunit RsxE [Bacillota bacterium]
MRVYWGDLIRGLWQENTIFRMMIGMCPTLAVTTSAINGFTMGIATTAVLICSSLLISILKNVIPKQVRIPVFIVVIATFVTIVDLLLAAAVPDIHKVLGLFVPLIVVNCLILGRAEAFASKMPVMRSIADAIGMGLGFTWALAFIGSIRELLGTGGVFGVNLLGANFVPWMIMLKPPGAFITMGVIVFAINLIGMAQSRKTGRPHRNLAPACHASQAAQGEGM